MLDAMQGFQDQYIMTSVTMCLQYNMKDYKKNIYFKHQCPYFKDLKKKFTSK